MTGPASAILSFVMLAVFALGAGGVYLIVKRPNLSGGDRHKGVLMIAAAAVLLVNVLIWTLPG